MINYLNVHCVFFQDIRSYFNLSGSKKPTKNANSTITKKRQAISSSDEEDSNKSITKLKEPVKKVRIILQNKFFY